MADKIELSPEDILALQQMVYGEGAGTDDETMKMIAQSAINRLRSGRKKEFGGTIPEILKKGYYAVSKGNVPYKQAVSGEFPDMPSKVKWGLAKKVVENMLADQDFGKHQFYFEKPEIKRQIKDKSFDFSKVKRMGRQDKYNLFGY